MGSSHTSAVGHLALTKGDAFPAAQAPGVMGKRICTLSYLHSLPKGAGRFVSEMKWGERRETGGAIPDLINQAWQINPAVSVPAAGNGPWSKHCTRQRVAR